MAELKQVVMSGTESSWRPVASGVQPRVGTGPSLVQFTCQSPG